MRALTMLALRLFAWLLALAMLGCMSGAKLSSIDGGVDPMPSPSPNAPTLPSGDPTAPTLATVRIAAGATAAYTDSSRNVWAADVDFTGRVTDASATPVAIAGTDSAILYNSERYGSANNAAASFGYTIAVPNGAYELSLGFAELFVPAAGQRSFNVSIDGTAVLTAFDIFAAAGAMNTAVVRSFPVTVTTGQIILSFDPGAAQNPKVNTISVVPAATSDGGS